MAQLTQPSGLVVPRARGGYYKVGGQISVIVCQQLSCNLIILRTSLHVEVIHRNARINIHVSQMHINISEAMSSTCRLKS